MPLGISKIGLFGGLADAPYLGTDVSADLLFHLKKVPIGNTATANEITTANGFGSNGFNIGGTLRPAYMTKYVGDTTFGSGTLYAGTTGNYFACARVEGNMTVSAGFDLYPSGDCLGMYWYIDGNLTVAGNLTTYQSGHYQSSASGSLAVNSSENEVAGSTVITMDGSAGAHTNGSSTASGLQVGGGGQGGYGSYGSGSGAIGHTFAGGSGGGGGGGVAYYNHCTGGGSGGGSASNYSANGGGGGNSGYTKWGYYTADAGGTGGNGNPAGGGGSNNSYNPYDSRAGYGGHSGSVGASMVIYATGDITVNSGGYIQTIGRAGQTGGTSRLSAGGGGGTGGSILVAVCGGTFTNNGTVATTGGSTGSGRGSGTSAGNGGTLTGGGYS